MYQTKNDYLQYKMPFDISKTKTFYTDIREVKCQKLFNYNLPPFTLF